MSYREKILYKEIENQTIEFKKEVEQKKEQFRALVPLDVKVVRKMVREIEREQQLLGAGSDLIPTSKFKNSFLSYYASNLYLAGGQMKSERFFFNVEQQLHKLGLSGHDHAAFIPVTPSDLKKLHEEWKKKSENFMGLAKKHVSYYGHEAFFGCQKRYGPEKNHAAIDKIIKSYQIEKNRILKEILNIVYECKMYPFNVNISINDDHRSKDLGIPQPSKKLKVVKYNTSKNLVSDSQGKISIKHEEPVTSTQIILKSKIYNYEYSRQPEKDYRKLIPQLKQNIGGIPKWENILRFGRPDSNEEKCSICNGSGSKPGTTKTTCPVCKGNKKIFNPGWESGFKTCIRCDGTGSIIKKPCIKCNRTGMKKGFKKIGPLKLGDQGKDVSILAYCLLFLGRSAEVGLGAEITQKNGAWHIPEKYRIPLSYKIPKEDHVKFDGTIKEVVKLYQMKFFDCNKKRLQPTGKVDPLTADSICRALVGKIYLNHQTPVELTKERPEVITVSEWYFMNSGVSSHRS